MAGWTKITKANCNANECVCVALRIYLARSYSNPTLVFNVCIHNLMQQPFVSICRDACCCLLVRKTKIANTCKMPFTSTLFPGGRLSIRVTSGHQTDPYITCLFYNREIKGYYGIRSCWLVNPSPKKLPLRAALRTRPRVSLQARSSILFQVFSDSEHSSIPRRSIFPLRLQMIGCTLGVELLQPWQPSCTSKPASRRFRLTKTNKICSHSHNHVCFPVFYTCTIVDSSPPRQSERLLAFSARL